MLSVIIFSDDFDEFVFKLLHNNYKYKNHFIINNRYDIISVMIFSEAGNENFKVFHKK